MPVLEDLGFSYVVLAVVLFPLLVLFASHKWRLSEARNEEVRRLIVLASEEADTAQFESSGFYTTTVSYSQPLVCAVCYAPTNSRCSQCKAVRYCSGRCQIIHWRRGHKDECLPCESHGNNNSGNSVQNENLASVSSDTHREERSGKFEYIENEVKDDYVPVSAGGSFSSESLMSSEIAEGLNRSDLHLHNDDMSGNSSEVENSCEMPTMENRTPAFVKLASPSDLWEGSVVSNVPSNKHVSDSNPGSSHHSISAKVYSAGGTALKSASTDAFKSRSSQSVKVYNHQEGDTKELHRFKSRESIHSLSCHAHNDPCSRDENCRSFFSSNIISKNSDVFVARSGPFCLAGSKDTGNFPPDVSHGHLSHEIAGSKDSRNFPADVSRRHLSHELAGSKGGKNLPPAVSHRHLSHGIERYSRSNCISGNVDATYSINAATSGHSCLSSTVSNGLRTSVVKIVDHIKPSKVLKHQMSFNVNELSKRLLEKGLFPYELFVKLYNWKTVEFRPSGLRNCGNSCYANVVLQCLALTPPLTAYLLQGLHSKACAKKSWCFICEFEILMLKAKDAKSPISPIGIISQLRRFGSNLSNGKEEDAHEFLRYAVDAMQSVCVKEAGLDTLGTFEEETTLIGLTFGGHLRSKVKCLKCHCKTERHERMMDLTVEIDGDVATVEEALRKFTGTEVLDGENRYKCSRCKSYERAKKKLTIAEAPNVLTIALKRFQSGKFGKINKPIRFSENLDLAPYMSSSSEKSNLYSLYGVVVHLDVMNAAFSGHYVCFVKNMQNKWFKIDDSTVKPVDRETVFAKGAYMLFYARCSPQAPALTLRRKIAQEGNTKLAQNKAGLFQLRTRSILDADSQSDNASLFSEEGSCSTESTRDSASTDDFSEYIFGDTWRSPRRLFEQDISASPSPHSSPIYSKSWYSGGIESQRCESRQAEQAADKLGNGSINFLYSDTTDVRRNVGSNRMSGESFRKPPRGGQAYSFN